jgi:hypothetical protein
MLLIAANGCCNITTTMAATESVEVSPTLENEQLLSVEEGKEEEKEEEDLKPWDKDHNQCIEVESVCGNNI